MSTAPPPAPASPTAPALAQRQARERQFIEQQIVRTKRALRRLDLAQGLLTLLIGVVLFLLTAAVCDHWLLPGGLGAAGRFVLFLTLAVGVVAYAWRKFVPLLQPINALYAAHQLEQSSPSFKNSLVNLLSLRRRPERMPARVAEALEHQAAVGLAAAPLDHAVDHSALLKLGYALVAAVACAALYGVLSPKNLAASAGRVLAPWANIPVPSRVQIARIEPGSTSVARGEPLEVSAEVTGLRGDEAPEMVYSTLDQRVVEQRVPMAAPNESLRFVANLPRGSGRGAQAAGVQQEMVYWIEAGDARSEEFRVTVYAKPTLVVEQVRYEYPAYTGYPSQTVPHTGHLRGIEGTRVVISALSNHPLRAAHVDFAADGRNDVEMRVDGDRATASFTLQLRPDRRTPVHPSYALRLETKTGLKNRDPVAYSIDVLPDYPPELELTAPEAAEVAVRPGETIRVGALARDPDFALANVRLIGRVGEREVALPELLNAPHTGQFRGATLLTPADLGLRAGEVLDYWAEARDNRHPEPNVTRTEPRRLKVLDPTAPPDAGQPGDRQQQGQPPADAQQQGPQQPGEGGGAAGGAGENAGQNSGAGAGEASPPGAGSAGTGEAGEATSADSAPGEGASGGAASEGANPSGDSQGAGGPAPPDAAAQPPSNGANDRADGQSAPNEQPGAANAPQDNAPPEGGQGGAAQPGPAGQAGGRNAPVSSAGDDDAGAFDRIMEHLNQQEANQPGGAEPQGGEAGQPGAADAQAGKPGSATPPQAGQDAAAPGQPQPAPGDAKPGDAKPGDAKPGDAKPGDAQAGAQPGAQAGQPQPQNPSAAAQPQGPGEASANPNGPADQPQPNAGEPSADAAQSPPPGAQGQRPGLADQPVGQDPNQVRQSGSGAGQNQGNNQPGGGRDAQGNSPQDAAEPGDRPAGGENPNQGEAGAGQQPGESEGAPGHERPLAPREKPGGDPGQRTDDQEPSAGATEGKTESDSQGAAGGDRAGGGQQGAGQRADQQGEGASGQNTPSDQGSGAADQTGSGPDTRPGDQQQADGPTGESSGDQPGAGSRAGDAQGASPQGGSSGPQPPNAEPQQGAGESAADASQDASQSAAEPQAEAGQNESQPPGGAPSGGAAPSAQGAGSKPQPSDSAGQQPGQGASSSQSLGGSAGGGAGPPPPGTGGAQAADEANLEYARRQTDLVLDRLDQQLQRDAVDRQLLDKLGWNADQLRQFVDRWKGLKNRAEGQGPDAEQAQRQLDAALRSLGLRPRGPQTIIGSADADDVRDLNDAFRGRTPLQYLDRFRAYQKGVGK